MAATNVGTLVGQWNTSAGLNLADDQEKNLTALLTTAVERTAARRDAAKQVLGELHTAVQSGDNSKVEGLLKQVRQGFKQAAEAREKFLDQFDGILQPEQRAKLVLALVQQAQQSGKPVEQFVDNLLAQAGGQN